MTDDAPRRKKQLGQYFTGIEVARLLAALAGAEQATSIIDPMVGTGDLLWACLELGATPHTVVGLDLDPVAVAAARERFGGRPEVSLRTGDAFTAALPVHQFDLVITNPPYIRYQSRADAIEVPVPGTDDIRRGVIRAVNQRSELSDETKQVLRSAATAYPGTADVAVPAWILSALLVADDGVLAMVVPTAWLSRNYARPVRDLLDAAFEVKYIVEDGDASWFPDAQVRTHLIVARRRQVDGSRTGRARVIKARASVELASQGSLVGEWTSETELVAALAAVAGPAPTAVTAGLIAQVETDSAADRGLVPALVNLLAGRPAPTRTLESFGWSCGQGMRTGANDFFYVTTSTGGGFETAGRWKTRVVDPPEGVALPAVRRQADLTEQFHVDPDLLSAHLLDLRGWATAVDRRTAIAHGYEAHQWDSRFRVLPDELAAWIDEVATTPLSHQEPDKLVPDLSAVAPNVRRGPSGEPLGYWYQLPPLTPRHRPELLLPRVCGGRPYAYANPDRVVVDANFSSLWPVSDQALPAPAMLAVLNSTWVWASLEATCTVLGGGALKVEATDLRRLALPELDALAIAELHRLGKSLATTGDTETLAEIDEVVLGALGARPAARSRRCAVRELAQRALEHRSS